MQVVECSDRRKYAGHKLRTGTDCVRARARGARARLARAVCRVCVIVSSISIERIHPMLITLRTPAPHSIVRSQCAGRAMHIRMDGFLPSMPQIASPVPSPPSIDPAGMAMSIAPFLLLPLFLVVANILVGLIFDSSTSPEEDRKMAERANATRNMKQSQSSASISSRGGLLDGLFGSERPEPPTLDGLFGGASDSPSPTSGPPASGGFFGNKGGGFLGDDAPLPPPPQQQPPLPPPPQQQPPVPVPPPPPTTNYAQEAAEEARRLAAERRAREEQESAAATKAAQEAAAAQQAQEVAKAAEAAVAQADAAESAPVPKSPPPPPADKASGQAKSAKERMAELKALLDDGLVTAEEFEAGRQRILDSL